MQDEQLPTVLENCPRETLVLASDGGAFQTCYTNADLVVAHLVGNAERDVDYIDDPGREKFPRVSAALRKLGNVLSNGITDKSCVQLGWESHQLILATTFGATHCKTPTSLHAQTLQLSDRHRQDNDRARYTRNQHGVHTLHSSHCG